MAFPRETLLGNRESWGRAGGTGTSLPLAPVGRGGEEGTRAGGEGGGLGRSRGRRLFPGGAASAVTSPLLPPPPPRRVAESPNQNKRRRLAPRAGPLRPRRRLTRRRKTRDGASALRSPAAAAAGRLPPGSLHSRPSPPRARPSPPPSPSGSAAAAPAPGLRAALSQRPCAAASLGAAPSSPRATQGAPGPQESPARVFGWSPESTKGVWENGAGWGRVREDAGVRVGGGGGALRLESPEWEGRRERRGRRSRAASYLTGKMNPSGGGFLVRAFFSRE